MFSRYLIYFNLLGFNHVDGRGGGGCRGPGGATEGTELRIDESFTEFWRIKMAEMFCRRVLKNMFFENVCKTHCFFECDNDM